MDLCLFCARAAASEDTQDITEMLTQEHDRAASMIQKVSHLRRCVAVFDESHRSVTLFCRYVLLCVPFTPTQILEAKEPAEKRTLADTVITDLVRHAGAHVAQQPSSVAAC